MWRQWMNSRTGTAQSHACRSARLWLFAIGCTSNRASLLRVQSLRLGAVRRLAYEAAECGLLSADLVAGIRRAEGVEKLGVRLGNWLTAEQGHALWQAPDTERLKGKRDCGLLGLRLACGLRRHDVAELSVDHLQQRERHCAIVDLSGKAGPGRFLFRTGSQPTERVDNCRWCRNWESLSPGE